MKTTIMLLFALIATVAVQGQNCDTLVISLGQKAYLQVDIVNDSTANFKKGDSLSDKTKTIELSLSDSRRMGNNLIIQNPLDKAFVYKAAIFNSRKNKFVESNVFPVHGKLSSIEMWGSDVTKVKLYSFKLKKSR